MVLKRNLIFLVSLVFLISLVSATENLNLDFGRTSINTAVNLQMGCDNSTYSNISTIKYQPNSTIILSQDTVMQKTGLTYNYTISSLTLLGDYYISGHCDVNGVDTAWGGYLEGSATGREVSLEQVYFYLFFLLLLILLSLSLAFIIPRLPNKNSRDEETRVLKISFLKYLRPVFIGIIYLNIMGIFFIGSRLSEYYLPDQFIGNLFLSFVVIMSFGMLVIVPIWFLKILEDIKEDLFVKKLLNRGIDLDA